MFIKLFERVLLWIEIHVFQDYVAKNLPNSPTILDAGANMGVTTKYYKKKYPNAHIIAIEPNPKTFKILEKNTRHLDNVQLLNKALIATNKFVYITDKILSWANTVSTRKTGTKVEGISLIKLLKTNKFDLIKII